MHTDTGPWHLLNLHKRLILYSKLRRREGFVERPREVPPFDVAVRLRRLRRRRRRLHHGAQRVAEAVVAPPVADAAQHGVPVQRPRPWAQVQAARHRRRLTLGAAFPAVAAVPSRRRRVLGHHGGRHGWRGN